MNWSGSSSPHSRSACRCPGEGREGTQGPRGSQENLKRGSTTLPAVLKQGQTDDIVGKMKVSSLLEAMPGVGKVRARQIMERLGIAESRRVRGLGANQRSALENEFGGDI